MFASMTYGEQQQQKGPLAQLAERRSARRDEETCSAEDSSVRSQDGGVLELALVVNGSCLMSVGANAAGSVPVLGTGPDSNDSHILGVVTRRDAEDASSSEATWTWNEGCLSLLKRFLPHRTYPLCVRSIVVTVIHATNVQCTTHSRLQERIQ